MKKFLLSVIATSAIINSQAQYLSDFDDISLSPESAWYGQDQVIDGDTILVSGNASFENNYNSGWGTFAGWSVSNITDNTTPGWGNQYSAITGSGNFSPNYGVCYVSSYNGNAIYFENGWENYFEYFMVTNTTYAYYAMLNGDSFSKPFGADTNAQGVIDGTNGEDWFLLTIYGLNQDSSRTGDSINFYLADYRFADDAQDYIINTWEIVELSQLQPMYGIEFALSSSDTTGGFGMNTPSYFAADSFGFFGGFDESTNDKISVYPNPTQGDLTIQVQPGTLIQIFDMSGKLIFEDQSTASTYQTSISHFENGIYLLNTITNGHLVSEKIVKY